MRVLDGVEERIIPRWPKHTLTENPTKWMYETKGIYGANTAVVACPVSHEGRR